MRRITLQIVAILTLAVTVAMVDGSVRGMKMPQKVTQTGLSDLINKSRTTAAATPKQEPTDSLPGQSLASPGGSPPPQPSQQDSTPTAAAQSMTAQELAQALELGLVVTADARRLDQYQAGHIPGAYFLPFEAFSEPTPPMFLDVVPATTAVVIYCDGGECHASHSVGSMLAEMGYTDVRVFEAGYPAWEQAGLPVEKGDPPL